MYDKFQFNRSNSSSFIKKTKNNIQFFIFQNYPTSKVREIQNYSKKNFFQFFLYRWIELIKLTKNIYFEKKILLLS